MFVTVTAASLWVTLPFQSWATVCPLVKVQVSVQLLMAAVPVLLMVLVAPKALVLCGEIMWPMSQAELEVSLPVSAMMVHADSEPEVSEFVTERCLR